MNLDRRLAGAMAIAFAFATDAAAATVCVQNKTTGRYEAQRPSPEGAASCAAMQQAAATPPTVTTTPIATATATATTAPADSGAQRAVAPLLLTPAPAAAKAPPVDVAQQQRSYRLKTSDITVRLALGRWLKESNMQLAYEAGEEFRTTVEADYVGSMSEVLLKLMTSLSQTRYPLRACEYDNRVVLVLHRAEVCPLEDE